MPVPEPPCSCLDGGRSFARNLYRRTFCGTGADLLSCARNDCAARTNHKKGNKLTAGFPAQMESRILHLDVKLRHYIGRCFRLLAFARLVWQGGGGRFVRAAKRIATGKTSPIACSARCFKNPDITALGTRLIRC